MVHARISPKEILLRGGLTGSDCAEKSARISNDEPSRLNTNSDCLSQLLLPMLNYLLSLLIEIYGVRDLFVLSVGHSQPTSNVDILYLIKLRKQRSNISQCL